MSPDREAVESLLAERPDLEAPLRELLELDADAPWTFDDVEFASGEFGELVNTSLVEQAEGGYQLSDSAAVRSVLDQDAPPTTPSPSWTDRRVNALRRRLTWDAPRWAQAGLVIALLLFVSVRLISWPAVFQGGDVVLSANDPYYYRYLVDQLLTTTAPAADLIGEEGEFLTVLTLWAVSALLGGSQHTAGLVLAWYPVVAGVIVALITYRLATAVADRRLGIVAVLFLAVTPTHAFRMSLGFADHDPFDNLILILTTLAAAGLILRLHRRDHSPRPSRDQITWVLTVGLGLSLASQAIAWRGAGLLIAPLGAYLALQFAADAHRQRSPLLTEWPFLLAAALGTGVVYAIRTMQGWPSDTQLLAPALLLGGSVAAGVIAEAGNRLKLHGAFVAVLEAVLLSGAGYFSYQNISWFREFVNTGLAFFVRLAEVNIGETVSLFAIPVIGPGPSSILGTFLLFGFMVVLGLPALVYLTIHAIRWDHPVWLLLSVYAWGFLALSGVQIRFADQLAPYIAIFAGAVAIQVAAFGRLTPPMDLRRGSEAENDTQYFLPYLREASSAEELRDRLGRWWGNAPETPSLSRWTTGLAIGILLVWLVTGLAISPLVINGVTTDPEQYEAAAFMADYADERGWEYPQNYVLSRWDQNRLYNYFVNGESRSYGYADNTFSPFIDSSDAQGWYDRLNGRVGFIVTGEAQPRTFYSSTALQVRLHYFYGGRGNAPGLEHYRAVYASDEGTVKVFTLVPGATIRGQADPNQEIFLHTRVEIPNAEFDYRRRLTTRSDGSYSVTVPYPGTYTIGDASVSVSERAVRNGTTKNVTGR